MLANEARSISQNANATREIIPGYIFDVIKITAEEGKYRIAVNPEEFGIYCKLRSNVDDQLEQIKLVTDEFESLGYKTEKWHQWCDERLPCTKIIVSWV